MAKKDFSEVNTERVLDRITAATAEPDTVKIESIQRKRNRDNPAVRTSLMLPTDCYKYISITARAGGYSMNALIELLIRRHMEEHKEEYESILKLRDSI